MGSLAHHLNRSSSPDLFRMLAELELSFTQVKTLFVLEDGEKSVKDIGNALGLSLPATSRAVDGLAQRGYVDRRESTEDRRSRLVALTPEGRRVMSIAAQGRRAALQRVVELLSDEERNALHAALLPLVERISTT